MSVGERIKEERERLEFNQDLFAEMAGVSRRSQIMYEQDKTDASAGYFTKIAEIGADVNYILTGVRMAKPEIKTETVLTGEGTMLKVDAVNEDVVSPKKRELMRLLERLDENALDDAIYSTKKLVENCEMKMMLQKLTAQQGQQQRMAA